MVDEVRIVRENLPLHALVESLSRQIQLRAEVVDGQCTKLLAHDFISDPPKVLAESIRTICAELAQVAKQIVSTVDWSKRSKIERSAVRLRLCDGAIKKVAAYLRFVDGALPHRLPWSAAPAFEKIARKLLPHMEIMLRAKWRYNYATHLEDVAGEFEKETAALLAGAKTSSAKLFGHRPFHVLGFPALEQRNIILHSLLGHEIGHLFARRLLTADREAQFADKFNVQLSNAVLPPDKAAAITVTRADALSYAVVWRRALEELLSDTVAAIVFGPAILFSSLEWAFSEGLDVQPDDTLYPPWRVRLRHLVQVLECVPDSTLPVPSDVFKKIPNGKRLDKTIKDTLAFIRSETTQTPVIGVHWINQQIYKHVLDDLPSLDRELIAIPELQQNRTRRKKLYRRMDGLVERLANGIPPNEYPDGETASLVEILNAAWLYRVGAASAPLSGRRSEDPAAVQDRISNLTLKAIELANIAEEYVACDNLEPR